MRLNPENPRLLSMQTRLNRWTALKIVVVPILTIALFFNDLGLIFSDALQSEATSYLILLPIVLTYIIYRKRKMLAATISIDEKTEPKNTRIFRTIAGSLAALIAILLYWYGSYTFTPIEYHMFSLPIFAIGLILILFNIQTLRQLAFPIMLLIFLIPPPSEILYVLGGSLSTISSQASYTIINTLGVPSTLTAEYNNPTISITQPNGATVNFAVGIACSGIYSIIAFALFSILVAYIIRDKPWKKLAIILIGIPVIYLLNIVRITIILAIGYQLGEDLALNIFHTFGGIALVFGGTLLLLLIADKILKANLFPKTKTRQPDPTQTQTTKDLVSPNLTPKRTRLTKIDFAKIFALSISVILLLSIQAPVFALTQSPAEVIVNSPTGQQTAIGILPDIPNYNLQFYSRDQNFEEIAQIDMALSFAYITQNTSEKNIWVSIEIASALSNLHRWELCLIEYPLQQGSKPRVEQISLEDIPIGQNPPVITRYFAFKDNSNNQTQAVIYWYESAAFTGNSTMQRKNVKISVIAYPDKTEDLPQIKPKLEAVVKTIIDYWQPIQTWSPTSLAISQNGAQLAEATTIPLAILILWYAYEERRQKKLNTKAYQKLSDTNKQIINAIDRIKKPNNPTLETIAETINETNKPKINPENLLNKLVELEKTGLIRRHIASEQDQPTQIWKT
jgi:exosortase